MWHLSCIPMSIMGVSYLHHCQATETHPPHHECCNSSSRHYYKVSKPLLLCLLLRHVNHRMLRHFPLDMPIFVWRFQKPQQRRVGSRGNSPKSQRCLRPATHFASSSLCGVLHRYVWGWDGRVCAFVVVFLDEPGFWKLQHTETVWENNGYTPQMLPCCTN